MLVETTLSKLAPISDQDRIDYLASLLTRVFDKDPHFNWLVRQDARRGVAMFRLFQLLLGKMPEDQGEVFVSTDSKAVAIWYPPGAGYLSLWRQLAFLRAYLSICGWAAFPTRALGLQIMEAQRPRRPHFFLQVIGVDENRRGQRQAWTLVEPVLRRCDDLGLAAYLETANPENLGFYARLGFSVMGDYRVPGGLRLWRFLREPACGVEGLSHCGQERD